MLNKYYSVDNKYIYSFRMWERKTLVGKDIVKLIVKYETKTAKQMTDKITKLAVKMLKKAIVKYESKHN